MYYWLRIASIIFNFVAYVIVAYRSNSMMSKWAHSTPTDSEVALKIFTDRMLYFPAVQTFSRLGAAVYEGMYGFSSFPADSSTKQFVVAVFDAVLTPSAGLGYLIVFVMFQTDAYRKLVSCCPCNGIRRQRFTANGVTESLLTNRYKSMRDDELLEVMGRDSTSTHNARKSAHSNSDNNAFHDSRDNSNSSEIGLRTMVTAVEESKIDYYRFHASHDSIKSSEFGLRAIVEERKV